MTTASAEHSPSNDEYDPLYLEAINAFREKHARTSELGVREPAAMSLATVAANGQPSIRTVLLRGIDERGFVFFTNSQSRKGEQMAGNSQVALTFYWDAWAEQIHVEGRVEVIPDSESDEYLEKSSTAQPDRRVGFGSVSAIVRPRRIHGERRGNRKNASKVRTLRGRPTGSATALSRTESNSGPAAKAVYTNATFTNRTAMLGQSNCFTPRAVQRVAGRCK